MAKLRVRPWSPMRSASMSRRSTRTQKEWKVDSCGLDRVEPASSLFTRSPISAEALLVKVTARMESGATPLASMRYAMRCVITRVFPEPAPARISTGPSVASTAARCCGFIFSSRGFTGWRLGGNFSSSVSPPAMRSRIRKSCAFANLEELQKIFSGRPNIWQ